MHAGAALFAESRGRSRGPRPPIAVPSWGDPRDHRLRHRGGPQGSQKPTFREVSVRHGIPAGAPPATPRAGAEGSRPARHASHEGDGPNRRKASHPQARCQGGWVRSPLAHRLGIAVQSEARIERPSRARHHQPVAEAAIRLGVDAVAEDDAAVRQEG